MSDNVVDPLRVVLHKLNDDHATDQQRDQLRLFALYLGLNWAELENTSSIAEIYDCISRDAELGSKAVALLHSVLLEIQVHRDTANELKQFCTQNQLIECQNIPSFVFGKMVMEVILSLGKDHFVSLKSMVGVTAPNVTTHEKLFRRLYQSKEVCQDNVKLLKDALVAMKLNTIADKVKEYEKKQLAGNGQTKVKGENKPTQETELPTLDCYEETEKPKEDKTKMVGGKPTSLPPPSTPSGGARGIGYVTEKDGPRVPEKPTQQKPFPNQPSDTPPPPSHGQKKKKRDKKPPLSLPSNSPRTGTPSHSINSSSEPKHQFSVENPPPPSPDSENTPLIRKKKTFSEVCRDNAKCICEISITGGLLFAIVALAVIVAMYVTYFQIMHPQSVLGVQSDTVVIAQIPNGAFLSSVNVSQRLEEYDHSQSVLIYTTPKLIIKDQTLTNSSPSTYQQDPFRRTGKVEYYLLQDSKIDYTMCIATPSDNNEGLNGDIYVFNNLETYVDYINGVEGAESGALCHRELDIGTSSNTQGHCQSISSCVASKNGYYFIVADTPGNVVFSFNYTIQQKYLEWTDYEKQCTLSSDISVPCPLSVKSGDYVLGYIEVSVGAEAETTHLELQPVYGSAFIPVRILVFVLIGVFSLCLLSSVFGLVLFLGLRRSSTSDKV